MISDTFYSKYIKGFLPRIARRYFEPPGSNGTALLIGIALIVITLAVYVQVGNHQFLNLDDNTYVTENPHVASGLTGSNILWAVTSVESYNWHPLTWLSHMADVQFYGMNPRGHHLTNVVIHAFATLLLFMLLLRLTGAPWQSSFVAALFALHPLHVESVAWVAERKDVLSALFWFLTLIFYAGFVVQRKPSQYILTLISFVLGLMSKPMLVTLPIIMLLMDFWPLERYCHEDLQGLRQLFRRLRALTTEKMPFFVCALFSCLMTIYAQHKGGAVAGLTTVPFLLRSKNALVAYATYLGKTLWPRHLAVFYPFNWSIPSWQVIGSLLILLLITIAALRSGRRYPYIATGWFWFLITLLPVIGLIQVGAQSMADRYTYIPVVGLFIMVAWGIPELTKGLRNQKVILILLASGVIISSAILSWHQLGYWRDNITLYRQTLKVTTDNYTIHNNLGIALQMRGDIDAAIHEYEAALRINPNCRNGQANLEIALIATREREAAIRLYREMIQINPNNANAHSNLGSALAGKGNLDEAIKEYQVVRHLNPNDTGALKNLELALARKKAQRELGQ